MKILSFTLAVLAFCVIARPVVDGNPIQELQFKFNVDNYKVPKIEPNDSILDELVNALKKFIGLPEIQKAVHDPATGVIAKVQNSMKQFSEESQTMSLQGINQKDIPKVVDTVFSESSPEENQRIINYITNVGQYWNKTVSFIMNKTSLTTKYAYARKDKDGTFRIATCNLHTAFQGENIEIIAETKPDKYGVNHTVIITKHSPLTPAENKRLIEQLEYTCSNDILNSIGEGDTFWKEYESQLRFFHQNPNGIFDDIENAVLGTGGLAKGIADTVSNFLESSSQSVQFLKEGTEFTRFQSTTVSAVLGGVDKTNGKEVIKRWVTDTVANVNASTLDEMYLLLLGSEGKEDLNLHSVQFNQTTGGVANSVFFYLTFIDENKFNLGLCTIGATFQVEGDLEIITTHHKFLGGLFSGGSTVKVNRMPPVWTKNDSYAVNEYMHYECASELAQKWGHKAFPPLPVH
jgi:hypothetical protein